MLPFQRLNVTLEWRQWVLNRALAVSDAKLTDFSGTAQSVTGPGEAGGRETNEEARRGISCGRCWLGCPCPLRSG